ncbi:MAG: tetratricopeptide repeat protein, partial [Bacteroidetes bacterium]
ARLVERLEPVFRNPNVNIDAKIGEILPLIEEAVQNDDRPRMETLLRLTRLLEEVHPNEAKAFAVTADLLFHSGRTAEAVEHYRQTLELDDSVYLVWEQLLNALAQLRRWKELTRSAEEALELFPNQATLNYLYGLGLLEQGKAPAAVSTLEQALLMAAGLEDLRFRILGLLGRALCEAGRLEEALRRFEEARSLNAQSPLLLATYARCLLSRNQLAKAKTLLEEASRLAPEHPAVLETRGDALFLQGDVDAALQWWQKALEKDPENESLKRKISSRSLEGS